MVPGPKGSPMGMGPNDPMQPLPPSGNGGGPGGPGPGGPGPGGNFNKNSPIIDGPNMNDPHYAQQFQNFQQQLYATNTRGGGGGMGGGPPPGGMPQGTFFPGGPGSGSSSGGSVGPGPGSAGSSGTMTSK